MPYDYVQASAVFEFEDFLEHREVLPCTAEQSVGLWF